MSYVYAVIATRSDLCRVCRMMLWDNPTDGLGDEEPGK